MRKARLPIIVCASIALTVFSILSTILYLIDWKKEENVVSLGYNEIKVVEEFHPPMKLREGDNTYQKIVQAKNTGNTDAYVRMFVAFSSKEIDDISEVSNDDGVTFEKLGEFVPNNGWVKSDDSYYYYTEPLKPGESTPPLFTNVRTTFSTAEDIQQYELLVYAESVQTRDKNGEIPDGFDYSAVWEEFLTRK